MTSQQLTDLAHANLKEFNKEWWNEEGDQQGYTAVDMLAFHKQGIREGLAIAKAHIQTKEESGQNGLDNYTTTVLFEELSHLLPEDPQPTSL